MRPLNRPRQPSPWGVRCLIVFLLLQTISIFGIDVTIIYDFQVFLMVKDENGFRVLEIVSGRNSLSLILVSVLTKYGVPEGNTTAMIWIRGAYGVWMALYGFGVLFSLCCLIPFIMDQAKETTATVACCVRWMTWCFLLGLLIGSVDAYFLPSIKDLKFWLLSKHIIMCATESLSLPVFLFGKRYYNMTPYNEGKRSWKDLLRIVKTVLFCQKNTVMSEEINTSPEKRKRQRLMDRLRFKQGFLFIAILSVMALAGSALYVLQRIDFATEPDWTVRMSRKLLGDTEYLPGVVLIPVIELLVRKLPCSFWQNTTKDLLKLFGIGAFLMSLALTVAGGYVMQATVDNSLSEFWLLPQYILAGLAILIFTISVLNLSYNESPHGLASLISAIALCLFILAPLVEFLVDFKIRDEKGKYGDIVLFAWAGIMLLMLVVIYLPLCKSYLKTKQAIKELRAEDDLELEEDNATFELEEDNTTLRGPTSQLHSDLSSTTSSLPEVTGMRNISSIIGQSIDYAEEEDNLADLWLPGEELKAEDDLELEEDNMTFELEEDNTTLRGSTSHLLSDLSSTTSSLPEVTGMRNISSIIGQSTIDFAEEEDDLADLWLPGEEQVA